MEHVRNMLLYQWGKKNLGPCFKKTLCNMYITEENIIISPSFVNKIYCFELKFCIQNLGTRHVSNKFSKYQGKKKFMTRKIITSFNMYISQE
jgi:hypothetical protein